MSPLQLPAPHRTPLAVTSKVLMVTVRPPTRPSEPLVLVELSHIINVSVPSAPLLPHVGMGTPWGRVQPIRLSIRRAHPTRNASPGTTRGREWGAGMGWWGEVLFPWPQRHRGEWGQCHPTLSPSGWGIILPVRVSICFSMTLETAAYSLPDAIC